MTSLKHKTGNRHNVVDHVPSDPLLVPMRASVFLIVMKDSTSILLVHAKIVPIAALPGAYGQQTAIYVPTEETTTAKPKQAPVHGLRLPESHAGTTWY